MKRIRLLCLGRGLHGGGAERAQLTLLRYLDRSRFDITLFYLTNDGVLHDLLPKDISAIFGVRSNRSVKLMAFAILKGLFRTAGRSDLIFAMQDGTPIYLGALVARLLKIPCIAWMHTMLSYQIADLQRWHKAAYPFFYSLPNCFIAVSEASAEDLVKKVPGTRGKTVVLPNPVDIQGAVKLAEQYLPTWASEIYNEPTIVAVGRLIPLKAFDVLIEAVPIILAQGHDINLIIIGDGSERDNLSRLIKQKGLERKVFLLGFQKNIYPFLKKATLLVSSSRYEGLPTVILEALSLGVPVVATDCPGGTREILKNGEYGVLVEPFSADALARGILYVLDNKPLVSYLKNLGPSRAQDFEARGVTRQFESLFLKVFQNFVR